MSAETAVAEQPLSIVAQLAKLQHREVVLRHALHLLNRAHRRSRAALRRQAEADQAFRARLLELERLALVGNMAALAARVIGLADELRRPKAPKPAPAASAPAPTPAPAMALPYWGEEDWS